ncbi:hypothetical protein SAMN05445756_1566 [Kytococcus aerolatus]|uniref:Uncharacterized protein n=1 Tax=Kytococcus aerolatus TaxID=592308 RepID=A0A212U0G1_9MICO|nr:hypothetical protein SAMN05445756_1566 [Kytococcus aerolatus]
MATNDSGGMKDKVGEILEGLSPTAPPARRARTVRTRATVPGGGLPPGSRAQAGRVPSAS